ncbi:hypothetical protein PENSPDRAFT_623379 [Peniophora sp. CONT]|nr:hypothetical protein PENSPDRAFT_623379 [Peniophora sp. CONT]
MRSILPTLLGSNIGLLAYLASLPLGHASPTEPIFTDCFSGNNSLKLSVSTVYAQIADNAALGHHLNLTVIGQSPQEIIGLANGSQALGTSSTLFTTTDVLTFNIWTNNSEFCSSLRPPSPLPSTSNTSNYCPIAAGPFAFSSAIPLNGTNQLLTLQTRLRAVDSLGSELLCVDVDTTPLQARELDSAYGLAGIILWASVALAVAYWTVVMLARLSSAWERRAGWSGGGVWARVETLGFVVASAVSGEAFAKTPALLRFVTPSMRDIFFHTQWCAALGMVAVQWPQFVYPLLVQARWATLSYNITIAQPASRHWDPITTSPYNPPSQFADQLADQSSPLYINSTAPNSLYTLPTNTPDGIASWAYTAGLYPQDLFSVCMCLFLAIVAGTIVVSLLLWIIDALASFLRSTMEGRPTTSYGFNATRYSAASKDMLDAAVPPTELPEDSKSASSHFALRGPTRMTQPTRRRWSRLWLDFFSSFHFSVLHGNLVRVLMLFHLPITIFSSYQMTMNRSTASVTNIALAALAFAAFSIVIPVCLVVRLWFTSTMKLYDETRTLLSLGPLYNHYRHGSQLYASLFFVTNFALGVTIGCGQKSGTAQAIVILVVEVFSALFTSIWLPWGHGASMGLISFLFCVARIVIAVLLVTLTPTVSIGGEAGQWVSYVILFILGLVYLSFVVMLACKLLEAIVRIVTQTGFNRSRHTADSGLVGACALAGCCGSRKRRRRHRSKQSDIPLNIPGSQTSSAVQRKPESVSTPVGGPPSVLRPEHALRPYREDTDDESGFIMSSWHKPGYEAVPNDLGSPHMDSPTPKSSSGFARVGGGRAHFDQPYAAIAANNSTQTFPSVEPPSQRRPSVESTLPATAFIDAERSYSSLPPGAMAPHMRTKSQTAIIENTAAAAGAAQQVAPVRRQSLRPEIVSPDDDDDLSDSELPRKPKWFTGWKSRRYSDGDESLPSPVPDDAEGGRTFLGRKKRRGSQPIPARMEEPPAAVNPPGKSFVVVRPKQGSRPSTGGAGGSGSGAPSSYTPPS